MNNDEFESLVGSPESSVLDFKLCMYNFDQDEKSIETARFAKDVISFSNTIRTTPAYIIFGIKVHEDGSKSKIGIDKFVDDAIFQEKIKDKLFPRPSFRFYIFPFENNKYGVLEFPVTKYESPIFSKKNMIGIEAERAYYRLGSSNTLATPNEFLKINDWLRGLQDFTLKSSINSEVASLLKQLYAENSRLSIVFADILEFSRNHNLITLQNICVSVISGITPNKKQIDDGEYNYRIHDIIISTRNVGINPNPFFKITSEMVKKEMEKEQGVFFPYKMFFPQPLAFIEDFLSRGDGIATVTMKWRDVFPEDEEKDDPVYGYIFKNALSSLYNNIRQNAIDELMKI